MDRNQHTDDDMAARQDIDVVLADRDPLARGVIARSLAQAGGFRVVGETASGFDAVALCARLQPAMAVLELNLRDLDGVEATRRIARTAPGTRVMIISTACEEGPWLDALCAGAQGILAKDTPLEQVVEVVRSVARGDCVVPSVVTVRLIERARTISTVRRGLRPVQSSLSEREWEVVELLREGATTADLADALLLSDDTVYTHLKNVMRKLGVHSRREIVAAADALLQGTLVGT